MYSSPSTVKRAPAGSVITRTDTDCWAARGIALKPANVRKTNNPRRFAMFTFRTCGSGELIDWGDRQSLADRYRPLESTRTNRETYSHSVSFAIDRSIMPLEVSACAI